ncbi:hypothetical protein RR48_14372 [Papilio machaon]|uniref:Uncharacterized protein n=1 Tax=Papilio machaon TaxID=76193 RepID=A0A194QLU1_PAPMA|nr:hypothetical protein RR48_14372 [Papilio machaon]
MLVQYTRAKSNSIMFLTIQTRGRPQMLLENVSVLVVEEHFDIRCPSPPTTCHI